MPVFRDALMRDATALRDLERVASQRALGHVFPADDFPYPDAEVLSRWRRTLAEDAAGVCVSEDDRGALVCLVAWDDLYLRHLAVHPDHWGEGLARAAISLVLERSLARRLWCLKENHRALAFYHRVGYLPTGGTRAAEWPPHPEEVELHLTAG